MIEEIFIKMLKYANGNLHVLTISLKFGLMQRQSVN